MAVIHGKTGVVKVAADGGSPAAVGEITNWSFEDTADAIDVSVLGSTSRKYVSGITSASGEISAYFDSTDAQQALLDAGAAVEIEIHPSGEGAGTKYYTFTNPIITGASFDAGGVDGVATASFSFQAEAVTEATN